MRQFFALICVAAALTAAVGCAKSEPAPSSSPPPAEKTETPPADQPAEGTNP